MPATMPYTPSVITTAMPHKTITCWLKVAPATVPKVMAIISADSTKSVRIAPFTLRFS